MTAPERLTGLSQDSPTSQRRRTAAIAAIESPTSKRTPRATRTANKTTRLELNGVEDKDTFGSPAKKKKVETGTTGELPTALPLGATPKKTKPRKEVKQEKEDTQEQEPQVEETSAKAKRIGKVEEDQEPADPQFDGNTSKTVKRKRVVKVKEEEEENEVSKPSPKKAKRKKAPEVEVDRIVDNEASPTKIQRKTEVKEAEEDGQEGENGQKKVIRKRKTKEEKELEAMPIAARTDGLRMFIGAHVSGAKGRSFSTYIATIELRLFPNLGVQNSVTNCLHIGYIVSKSGKIAIANMSLAEMPLPCSSNHRKNGRTLLCKTNTEINSYHYAVSTSTTQQGISLIPIAKVDSISLTNHSIQSYPASRLLPRQSRPRRHRKGHPSLQCLPGRSPPLRISRYQTL